ncbi:MAG: alanyl-tRNA editing protein [Chloroflexota bacterium]
MTELLYLADANLRDFEARVLEIRPNEVLLDRTAFYPGGGGQPCDVGTLRSDRGTWTVRSLRKEGDAVWHVLESGAPEAGQRVRGQIDWEHRYQLMRTHTAMHILCGVIWRDYSACVTGGNMEPLKGRMDFEFETMRQELVREIEDKINQEVAAARPVRTAILPRDEAFRIPDLIRTKINLLPEGITQVRVVEIVGLDLQADGGTHVANTSEVGPLRILEYKSKGAINKRLVVGLQP